MTYTLTSGSTVGKSIGITTSLAVHAEIEAKTSFGGVKLGYEVSTSLATEYSNTYDE